jgi:biotin carboxyl carrier protein
VTIVGKAGEEDCDYKIEHADGAYTVTDLSSGASSNLSPSSFSFEHNSLVKVGNSEGTDVLQLLSSDNDMKFDFYFKGGKVETVVYDEAQYKYKQFMAPPVKIDTSKSLLSPMPGAVVSISVEPGQHVVDGQELCVIEAMKMQNILKSEKEGVIKSVKVKAGDSVAVDELLIEFE